MCCFVREGRKNLKSELWNNEDKVAVERKEDVWKDSVGSRDDYQGKMYENL